MTIPTAAYYLPLVFAVICSLLLKYNKTDSMSSEHTKHKKKAVHMFVYDFFLRFFTMFALAGIHGIYMDSPIVYTLFNEKSSVKYIIDIVPVIIIPGN